MLNPMMLMSEFAKFRTNPGQYLAARGMNIPQEYMANPQAAANYLMQQRNMSQQDINTLMQTAGQFQNFLGSQGIMPGGNGGNTGNTGNGM